MVWAKWMSASVGGTTSVGLGEAVPASAVDDPVGAVVAGSKTAAQAGEAAAADFGEIGCTFRAVIPGTTVKKIQPISSKSAVAALPACVAILLPAMTDHVAPTVTEVRFAYTIAGILAYKQWAGGISWVLTDRSTIPTLQVRTEN